MKIATNFGLGRATLPRGRGAVSLLQWEKVARRQVAVTDEVSSHLHRIAIFKLKFEYYLAHNFLFIELCKNQSNSVTEPKIIETRKPGLANSGG